MIIAKRDKFINKKIQFKIEHLFEKEGGDFLDTDHAPRYNNPILLRAQEHFYEENLSAEDKEKKKETWI
ncbi:MAG: hypothetical protein QME54_06055 [Actinomycetota bacterium]|nr:hypothetical protein [Actinomycetota bacterium]